MKECVPFCTVYEVSFSILLTNFVYITRSLPLADDEVTTGDMSEELLGCAVKTLEDYFVVPPGNIDFAQDEEYYHKLGENKEKKAV